MDNENEEKTKLCELCFVSCDENFVLVDDDKRNMLETVRLELDFSASKEPIICKFCAENVEKCYEFKTSCLYTEDCITSFSSEKNDDKVDLLDVYLSRNKNKDKNNLQDHVVCRLCLELVKCGSHIPLNGDTKDKMFLNQFFPELDLNVIRDPVICALCHISLQDYIDFMRNYSDADITVQKLRADEADSNIGSELNLEPELLLKNTLKIENDCELKVDKKSHELDMIDEAETKPEYLGTEGEEFFLKSEPVEDEVEPNEPDSSLPTPSESWAAQTTDSTYHCKLCEYKTERRYNFHRHMGIHHITYQKRETETTEGSPYQCKSCSFRTEYRTSMRRHMLLHKPPTYKCDFCDYKTITKYNLKNHLVSHHDPSNLTKHHCECCNFKTGYKGLLNRHMMIHHNGIEFSCKICPFKTKYGFTLTRHMLVHQDDSEVTMYSCEYCEYKTKHKRNVKMHLLSHKTIQASLHQCQNCQFKTRYVKSMRRHMALVHNKAPEQVYSCNLCEYQTTCKNTHDRHLLSHRDSSDTTIYRCGDCQFTTRYKTSLKRHKLVHQNGAEVRKYRCEVCQFETKYKCTLGQHMRLHHDESAATLYRCEHCKFKTKHKYSLMKHFLTHKTAREVPKDTYSPSFLSENRTVQATKNTYHCNFCKYKTDRRYNFQRHMGTHQKMCHELETETIQESPMYQCKSCSFKTKHMRSLRRHIIAFHNKASEQQVHSCDLCKMCPEPETEATQAHESSMYQCKSCLFKTKHMRSLKRHIIAFHSKASNQRVYSCDLCEYETTCKFYLSSHLLSHRDSSDATLYRCGECQYTNKYKAKLKRHKLVHQDGPEVKKFRCEVCQFQTKYKEKLSRHMVLHQDESEVTMYHCEHCKFKTKHKFSITKHLLTHKKKP